MKRTMILILSAIGIIWYGCDKNNSTAPEARTATFTVTVENVAMEKTYPDAGVFNTPVGMTAPAPIGPGESYEFTFFAAVGSKLSFATMMVQSNDFFYAPDENGIELFSGTTPISGDITSQIKLWDAGTEINQEPGLGIDQAPRQSGANTGAADPNNLVRPAEDTYSNLPPVSDVLRVTITPLSSIEFKVTIENVSTSTTLMTSDGNSTAVPLAPGVFVVHTDSNPLFVPMMADQGHGLEALAEDGDPSVLFDYLNMSTGITQIIAPGVYAVSRNQKVLFTSGMTDYGEGLENLAEDGDPSVLLSALKNKSDLNAAEIFNTPMGASSPGPAAPGNKYQFSFTAEEGDRLYFATMMVQSNDLFFAPPDDGLPLFVNGAPINGDMTGNIMLWDAGTEMNEMPGFGPNQAPRQTGPDTGVQESMPVQPVNDSFTYPNVSEMIKVTISAQ